jgi:5-methylcytosine-specific restriction endonuclease McrA
VLKHYGPVCWLCKRAIDLSLRWPHPFSYTVHHLVPLARGGALLDLDNARPAHLTCNSSQGARPHVGVTNTSCEW